jgi:hypothetical protein
MKDNKICCKYGSLCINPECCFFHSKKYTIKDMVFDIPVRINIKKNKKLHKNKKTCDQIINNSVNKDDIYIFDNSEVIKHDSTNIKKIDKVIIINKDKNIKRHITVDSYTLDMDKLLNHVDEYYINYYTNIINKKDNFLRKKVNDNYNVIINLRKENNKLKKKVQELENKCVTKSMVDISKNRNNVNINKLKNLYKKYVNIHNVFIKCNNNYKIIDMEYIKNYTKDKNIYKIKQRAEKVYNFYNKLQSGVLNDYLPISKIINMRI